MSSVKLKMVRTRSGKPILGAPSRLSVASSALSETVVTLAVNGGGDGVVCATGLTVLLQEIQGLQARNGALEGAMGTLMEERDHLVRTLKGHMPRCQDAVAMARSAQLLAFSHRLAQLLDWALPRAPPLPRHRLPLLPLPPGAHRPGRGAAAAPPPTQPPPPPHTPLPCPPGPRVVGVVVGVVLALRPRRLAHQRRRADPRGRVLDGVPQPCCRLSSPSSSPSPSPPTGPTQSRSAAASSLYLGGSVRGHPPMHGGGGQAERSSGESGSRELEIDAAAAAALREEIERRHRRHSLRVSAPASPSPSPSSDPASRASRPVYSPPFLPPLPLPHPASLPLTPTHPFPSPSRLPAPCPLLPVRPLPAGAPPLPRLPLPPRSPPLPLPPFPVPVPPAPPPLLAHPPLRPPPLLPLPPVPRPAARVPFHPATFAPASGHERRGAGQGGLRLPSLLLRGVRRKWRTGVPSPTAGGGPSPLLLGSGEGPAGGLGRRHQAAAESGPSAGRASSRRRTRRCAARRSSPKRTPPSALPSSPRRTPPCARPVTPKKDPALRSPRHPQKGPRSLRSPLTPQERPGAPLPGHRAVAAAVGGFVVVVDLPVVIVFVVVVVSVDVAPPEQRGVQARPRAAPWPVFHGVSASQTTVGGGEQMAPLNLSKRRRSEDFGSACLVTGAGDFHAGSLFGDQGGSGFSGPPHLASTRSVVAVGQARGRRGGGGGGGGSAQPGVPRPAAAAAAALGHCDVRTGRGLACFRAPSVIITPSLSSSGKGAWASSGTTMTSCWRHLTRGGCFVTAATTAPAEI